MTGNGSWIRQKLILGAVMVAGATLSGCNAVDRMFDDSPAPPPAMAAAAHVSPRDAVRARSMRCDAIKDERTWLDCYYGAAQPVRADLGLPPTPASQQALVPAGP